MTLEPVETTGKAELIPTHTLYVLAAGLLLHYCQALLATLTILRQLLVRSAPFHRQPMQSLAAVVAVFLPAYTTNVDRPFPVYSLSQIALLTKFALPHVDHPVIIAQNNIDHLLLPARKYVINTSFGVVNQLAAPLLGAPADLILLNLLFDMSQQTFLAEKMGAAE